MYVHVYIRISCQRGSRRLFAMGALDGGVGVGVGVGVGSVGR